MELGISIGLPRAAIHRRPHLAIKSQPDPRFVRPKLDVGASVKSGDHIAAGHDRELRAQSGHGNRKN